jgi:hypothetical protein
MSAETRTCNNDGRRGGRRESYTDVPQPSARTGRQSTSDMERALRGDSQFFESVLRRYVSALGALHPDQARRDFFVYARQAKGFNEAEARAWATSQVELLVTRATHDDASGS